MKKKSLLPTTIQMRLKTYSALGVLFGSWCLALGMQLTALRRSCTSMALCSSIGSGLMEGRSFLRSKVNKHCIIFMHTKNKLKNVLSVCNPPSLYTFNTTYLVCLCCKTVNSSPLQAAAQAELHTRQDHLPQSDSGPGCSLNLFSN